MDSNPNDPTVAQPQAESIPPTQAPPHAAGGLSDNMAAAIS